MLAPFVTIWPYGKAMQEIGKKENLAKVWQH
jgi:hypothetical protein